MNSRIIRNLSNEEYHNAPEYRGYISSTQLKNYRVSPKYAKFMLDNPAEQTDAMKFGSLFHDLMASLAEHKGDWGWGYGAWLEGLARFDPPINGRTGQPYGAATKAYAEAYQQFLADNNGKTIVNAVDSDLASDMAHSLLFECGATSRQVCKLLKWSRVTEVSYFCETEDGVRLKIRPDMLTAGKLIDWKSIATDSLDRQTIARQIERYGYHISMSMYQWVLHEITGKWYRPYLVFVCKAAPFDCVIVDISRWCYTYDEELDMASTGIGAVEFKRLLDLHTECGRKDEWPGAERMIGEDNGVMLLDVPFYLEQKTYNEQ